MWRKELGDYYKVPNHITALNYPTKKCWRISKYEKYVRETRDVCIVMRSCVFMDIMYFDDASGKVWAPEELSKTIGPFRMRQVNFNLSEVRGNQGISCGYILPQTQSGKLLQDKAQPCFVCSFLVWKRAARVFSVYKPTTIHGGWYISLHVPDFPMKNYPNVGKYGWYGKEDFLTRKTTSTFFCSSGTMSFANIWAVSLKEIRRSSILWWSIPWWK